MEKLNYQYFNTKKSLYYVLYDYLIINKILIPGIDPSEFSKNKLKRIIESGIVLVNNIVNNHPTFKLSDSDIIQIPSYRIEFKCVENITYANEEVSTSQEKEEVIITAKKEEVIITTKKEDLSKPLKNEDTPKNKLDDDLLSYIKKNLSIERIDDLDKKDPKRVLFHIIEIFQNYGFDSIKTSKYSYKLTDSVKKIFHASAMVKELQLSNKITPFPNKIISSLIRVKIENEEELNKLVEELLEGLYNSNLYKFLQNYNRLTSLASYKYLIEPQLNNIVTSSIAIENLIKPIQDAKKIDELDSKFNHYESNSEIYIKYLSLLDDTEVLQNDIFKPIATYLFGLLKEACETNDIKSASLEILASNRKYNFTNKKISEYDILLVVKNLGEGLARDVKILPDSCCFQFDIYSLGILNPNESRDIIVNTKVLRTEDFSSNLKINCEWLDMSNETVKISSEILLQSQTSDVPWSELEKRKPYSIQEIEDKNKLYGRDEILNELENNILSDNIESYKIWGQKRVGKSSIVRTLKTLFKDNQYTIVVWRSIAGLKNTNPELTLNSLGESLVSEIVNEINIKLRNSRDWDRLRDINVPDFHGSLFPLENYINKLKQIEPNLKFIFIIDEFDRINEEFFLPGDLGDTLSLNIGKGLNVHKYVGFILVGSENMQLLDRQAINYNNYKEYEVDTFNKESEYESFKNIIIGPVSPDITYSDESIEKIFTSTNGNPYFANLICDYIFKIILKNQDSEVDVNTASKAIDIITNSSQKSHFEHFWNDGIAEETSIKKERKVDIRRRILISYSNTYYKFKDFPNRQNILKNFNYPKEYTIENYEIENTIKEFFNRNIFIENKKLKIRILPNLFEEWLCGPGRTLMIEGISDIEALHRESEKEQEYELKPDEINRINDNFIFKGEKITYEKIQNYFNQFGGPFSQRRIFNIIDSITYTSKEEISDFFRREQKNIFRKKSIELKEGKKTVYRENIEIYTFPDTYHENIEIVETFKLFSRIRKNKILKDTIRNKDSWKQKNADDIIIFESVIADYSEIKEYLDLFLDSDLIKEKIPIKLVVLLITSKAKTDIIKATSVLTNFKLIQFKEIEDSRIKPFIDNTDIFETSEESGYVFSEVKKHFSYFNKESLNVLFETHCPQKSLPILWCKSNNFDPLFHNQYGNIPENKNQNGENLRLKLADANNELSQNLNSFIVNYLKKLANSDDESKWFRVELIPKSVLKSVSEKHIADDQKDPIETYFDFLDYKKIIEMHHPLIDALKRKSEGLKWLEKCNELRRIPAHPEKPPPTSEQYNYFLEVVEEIIAKMKNI